VGPFPVADLGHVFPVFADVLLVLDQLFADGLLGVRRQIPELGHPVDYIGPEMKAVQVTII